MNSSPIRWGLTGAPLSSKRSGSDCFSGISFSSFAGIEVHEKPFPAGLQGLLLKDFWKGRVLKLQTPPLCSNSLVEEMAAASGRYFWYWSQQLYCETCAAVLGMVGSGKDRSIRWASQAGWWLQRNPSAALCSLIDVPFSAITMMFFPKRSCFLTEFTPWQCCGI